MRILGSILRRIITSRYYYLGTLFSMLSYLSAHVERSDEEPSEISIFGVAAFILFLASLFCGALLVYQNRARFVTKDGVSRTSFCRAIALFYAKIFLLLVAATLPFVIPYQWLDSDQADTWTLGFRIVEVGAALTFLLMTVAVAVVVHNGAAALVVARGHSRHCIRDSLRAFRTIWRQIFFTVALTFVPSLIAAPFRIFSSYIPLADWLTTGMEFAFLPYQFALANAAFLFFAKSLRDQAPGLAGLPEPVAPNNIYGFPLSQPKTREA